MTEDHDERPKVAVFRMRLAFCQLGLTWQLACLSLHGQTDGRLETCPFLSQQFADNAGIEDGIVDVTEDRAKERICEG